MTDIQFFLDDDVGHLFGNIGLIDKLKIFV